MRFYYEWNEPELAQACFKLEEQQVIEQVWRAERRRASLTVVLLFLPLLVALLAVSFDYLIRKQVSGSWSVLAVTVLGGLLAGTLSSLRLLAPLVRSRLPRPAMTGQLPWLALLAPLLGGVGAGAFSAYLLTSLSDVESYRPQTLYLIGFATSIACARLLPVRMVLDSSNEVG